MSTKSLTFSFSDKIYAVNLFHNHLKKYVINFVECKDIGFRNTLTFVHCTKYDQFCCDIINLESVLSMISTSLNKCLQYTMFCKMSHLAFMNLLVY